MKNHYSLRVIVLLVIILFSVDALKAQCNTNAPNVYTFTTNNSTTDIYQISPNPLWKGGDTIKIAAGNYTDVIEFDHLHGDACRPIIIINSGSGQVTTATMRFKSDCEYVHVTGTGDPNTLYGFKCLAGPLGGDYGQHLEFDHIEITNPNNGVGISFKTIQDTTAPGSYYVAGDSNYLSVGLHFHNLYIHNTLGEGMYIGPSDPDGGNEGTYPNGTNIIPLRLDSVEIDHCILDTTGWDGIQLSNARYGAKIHDNTVTNYGVINEGSQQAGIILGGNTEGAVYNNTVSDGTGNGIQLFGYGQQVVYGNTLDSVGIDYLIPGISLDDSLKIGQASIFSHDYINHVETDSPMTVVVYDNQFNYPQKEGAIFIDDEDNNSLPSNIHDNKFCIPGALTNWQSTYLLLNVAGSSNVNNILYCGPLIYTPIANAGADTVITLPANSVTLRGSGTETNGKITAYKWTKASGPTAGIITSATSAITTVTGLTAGIYKFVLTITDSVGLTATDTVQVTVNATPSLPVISSAAAASGTVGTVFSYSITASNSPTSYAAAGLPSGLSINTSTGVISGTPINAGISSVTISAINAGGTGTKVLTITITAAISPAPVVSSASSVSGITGTVFSYNITASNSPTSYAAVGLPSGLSINTSTGVISGTPITAGISSVTISATNAGGTGTKVLTITITAAISPAPVISSAATASGTVGTAFSYSITASNSPTSYAATGLPAGLSVKALTGVISGTPTNSGTSTVTISAINSGGTGTKVLTITINPSAPVISSVAATNGMVGTIFSYSITASNSPTSYAATGLPSGLTVNTSSGIIEGTPTTAGTYNTTISATNAGGTGSKTLVITINAQSVTNSGGTPITLYEPFESGLPTSPSNTVENYTLVSGIWTILRGASSTTKHNGSLALKLSGGSTSSPTYAEAPPVDAVSTVSFWAKASSNTTYTIQKSVNGGPYITIATQAVTTTYTLYTITVNETGNNVRIKFENTTDKTAYIDDVTIIGSSATISARAADIDQNESVILMPNPVTQGRFTVTTPGWNGEVTISIMDFQGNLVQKNTTMVEGSEVNVEVSNLSKGAYIVQLRNGDELITKKFLLK